MWYKNKYKATVVPKIFSLLEHIDREAGCHTWISLLWSWFLFAQQRNSREIVIMKSTVTDHTLLRTYWALYQSKSIRFVIPLVTSVSEPHHHIYSIQSPLKRSMYYVYSTVCCCIAYIPSWLLHWFNRTISNFCMNVLHFTLRKCKARRWWVLIGDPKKVCECM